MIAAILTAAIVLFATYCWHFYSKVKKYPKGPTPFPIIGNFTHFRWNDSQNHLQELAEEYGPIFTLYLPHPTLCIMSYEGIKDAFVNHGDDFAGRPGGFPQTAFQSIENGGIVFSQGESWRDQRRISLHILRDFGMGKGQMETQVRESMEECISHIAAACSDGKSVNLRWPLQLYVGNVISNVLYGIRYKYDDCDRVKDYCQCMTEDFAKFRENKLIFLPHLIPWIEHVPIIGDMSVGDIKRTSQKLCSYAKIDMAHALKGYDTEIEPENFCQAYYQKMTASGTYDERHLTNICFDFFLAGMETTSTTLRWAMLYMAVYPDVQDKMRKEIEETIGLNAFPSMADKQKLPYCNAVVNEIQRCANIVSMNVVHRTTRDTSVLGHKIPENTIVFGQIYSILDQSPVFVEPKKFRPERFLEADGKTPNKTTLEHLVPFSMGKRQCAGEGLARLELFLGLISIVQNFKIEEDPEHKISLEPFNAGILLPQDKPLKITPTFAK